MVAFFGFHCNFFLISIFYAVDNKNDDLCEQAAMALETSTVVCCVSGQLQPLKVKHAIIINSCR